jgi:uncharacterized protein YjgD (DUF1641 family)
VSRFPNLDRIWWKADSGSGSALQREIAANATERILGNDKHIMRHVIGIDVEQTSKMGYPNSRHQAETAAP